MLATLALALTMAPATLTLEPTDDVWVYPHATDPSKDFYLRVWGTGGISVATSPADNDEFSYSYLKFSFTVPAGKKLSKAELVLTHVAEPGYTLATAKERPIEARPLKGTFDEKNWNSAMNQTVTPDGGQDAVFGTGTIPESGFPSATDFPITFDLLKGKGDFAAYVAKNSGTFGIALASRIDPSEGGMKAVYKTWSRNAEEAKRPKLKLTFED